jgi:uncharacterized membrane protein
MVKLKRIAAGIVLVLSVLYPLAVYWGIQYLTPRAIGSVLLILLILRYVITRPSTSSDKTLLLIGVIFCQIVIWQNSSLTLLFYPAIINFSLFSFFFLSLYFPPPVIERLARLQHPDLPDTGVRYTRQVTRVWCIFFMLNALISLWISLYGSLEQWSLYNGLIAYLLMGLLMTIEYIIRIRTQAHVR